MIPCYFIGSTVYRFAGHGCGRNGKSAMTWFIIVVQYGCLGIKSDDIF